MGLFDSIGNITSSIGKVFSPVSDLLGFGADIMGNMNAASANKDTIKHQDKWNRKQYEQTEKWNTIGQEQWRRGFEDPVKTRVADARAANVHPLAALGVSSTSPQGFTVGSYRGSSHRPGGASRYLESFNKFINNINAQKAQTELDLLRKRGYQMDLDIKQKQMDYWDRKSQAGVNPPQESPTSKAIDAIISPVGSTRPGPHSSTQEVEDEYGDAVGTVHGITRYIRDRNYRRITRGRPHPPFTDTGYHSRRNRKRRNTAPYRRNARRRNWRN